MTVAIADTDDSVSVYGHDSEGCKNAIAMIMKSVGGGPKAVEGKSYKGEIIKVLVRVCPFGLGIFSSSFLPRSFPCFTAHPTNENFFKNRTLEL